MVAFALVTGVPAGVLSALYPRLGRFLMRVIDVLMSFPALLLALGLIVILGQSVANAILAIGVVYLTRTSRITFGLTLRLRTETYVEAAISMGGGAAWTIRKHILPNLISPLLVQASFVFAFAQLSAASLDFLGLGAPPDIPSWGQHARGIAHFSSPARHGCCSSRACRSPSPLFRSTSSATPCAIGSIRASARCSAATGDRRCCG